MHKMHDLTDREFGALTVLKRVPDPRERTFWLTRCKCGTEKVFSALYLKRRGDRNSCGCLSRTAKMNLIGEKFGSLLVVGEAKSEKGKSRRWKCICDCGRERDACHSNLRRGTAVDCGFHRAPKTPKEPRCIKPREPRELRRRNLHDLTKQRFGRLVAQYELERKPGEHRKWHCLCDCGEERDVFQCNLRTGGTRSCGCLQRDMKGIQT